VRLSTSLGSWAANGTKSITLAPIANVVSATLVAGNASGNADIQIDALDGSGNVLGTQSLVFSLSAPSTLAG